MVLRWRPSWLRSEPKWEGEVVGGGGTTRRDVSIGALDGGPQMSPVDFKKWQCPLSLF